MLTDDQSWDSVGYANPQVKTPNVDRLARRGMIFTAGHCSAMPCIPSRGCIMSGLDFHRWQHVFDNILASSLKESTWTWAHALREAGYDTGMFGKMHFWPTRSDHGFGVMQTCDHVPDRLRDGPDPRWWDDYQNWMKAQALDERHDPKTGEMRPNGLVGGWEWPHDIRLHPISWVRDRAIEFIDNERAENRRFAIIVSFRFPHAPFNPAEPFASMYDPRSIEVPRENWKEMEGYVTQLDVDSLKGFNWAGHSPDEPGLQLRTSKIWGLCSQIDDAVGSIVQHLDLTDTLVVYASDHGDYMGKRGRIEKMPPVPFEALSRVPYFAAGYGVTPGTTCANPVVLVDVAPTFLRAAGLEVPSDLDGHPLQDYFRDPRFGDRRSIYCFGGERFAMVQMGRVKYFRSQDKTQEMVFDLETDPREVRNLASDPKWQKTKARLAKRMDAVFAKRAPDLPKYDAQSRRTA
jgi:arylsulfatase A-like enzyme